MDLGVPRGLSPHRVSRQEPGPELPAEFQGHGGKHSSPSPLPGILLPPPSFPPLLTSLCPLRCWRSCRPPRDPPCSSPSLSSLLPSGRSWQPSSSSSPSCSPQTHKHREQWLVDLLTWGGGGSWGSSPPSHHPVADGAQLLNLTLHLVTGLQGGTHSGTCPRWGPRVPPSPHFPSPSGKRAVCETAPLPRGSPSAGRPQGPVSQTWGHRGRQPRPPRQWGSPGPRSYRDTQAMRAGTPKMRCRVLLSCMRCPLTLQRIQRLCTSAGDTGDVGTGPACPHRGGKHGRTGSTGLCWLRKGHGPCRTWHRLPGDNGRPQGTEGVEGFAQQPLPPVALLPVPGTHVVGHRVAQHVLQGLRLLGTAGTVTGTLPGRGQARGTLPGSPRGRDGSGVPRCAARSSR